MSTLSSSGRRRPSTGRPSTARRVAVLLMLMTLVCGAPRDGLAQPQSWHVHLALTSEGYDMEDALAWQAVEAEVLQQQAGVTPQAIQSFPRRWAPSGRVTYALRDAFRVGVHAGYSSTGGRVSHVDYSGDYRFDQEMDRWYVGPMAEYRLAHASAVALWAGGRAYVARSVMKAERELRLGDVSVATQKADFTAFGVGVMPYVSVEVYAGRVGVSAFTGYDLDLGNRLVRDGTPLEIAGIDTPSLSWGGARFGFELGVRLN